MYYIPTGWNTLLTVNASSGAVLVNASLSSPYDLPATQWDPATGLLYALGMPGGTVIDAIAITPSTGQVAVVSDGLTLDGVQLCEVTWSSADPE